MRISSGIKMAYRFNLSENTRCIIMYICLVVILMNFDSISKFIHDIIMLPNMNYSNLCEQQCSYMNVDRMTLPLNKHAWIYAGIRRMPEMHW